MKRIILISLSLFLCLSAAHAQKLAIKGLSTQSIQIGNKTLTKGNVFNANEKIHWSVKRQSMRLMFQDGEKRGLPITVCREAMERIGAENVAQYLCWCNQTWFERFKSNFGLTVNNKPSTRGSVELMEKTASNFPEKRLALVIGNSNYEYLDPLANPLNDVTKVAEKLQSLGFDVLPVYDADDREINSKLNWLKRQSKYDVVIVYYSGHGIQNGNKQYLIPVNGKLDDENDLDYCISLDDVYARLNALGESKTKLVFIDACRNKAKWQGPNERDSEEESGNIAVVYSTSKGTKASDGEAGENSPFAEAFLEEIGKPTDNLAKTIGLINENLKKKTSSLQSVSDHGISSIKFVFNPNDTRTSQKVGISLKTDKNQIQRVASGYIKEDEVGFSAKYFDDGSVIAVKLSNSVNTIQDFCFESCESLFSISIPASVTNIGMGVFKGCINLSEITIAPENPVYDSREECNAIIEKATNTLIAGCKETIIPEYVTTIGKGAFADCTELESIDIPESVICIEEGAFAGCSRLKNITIPNSVTSIGREAFSGCESLDSIVIPSSVTTIEYGTFSTSTGLKYISLPEFLTSIEDVAFSCCTGLDSITIPNSVKDIKFEAFAGCTKLKNISLPNSITSIGKHAFLECIGLDSITIPNSVKSIGEGAFEKCTALKRINIPNSVTSIGDHAFLGCTELETLTIPKSLTDLSRVFYGCTGLIKMTIPEYIKDIGFEAFKGCTALKSIILPNSVTRIANGAFSGCTALESITLPNSVQDIGNYAFYECTGLTSINIPNSMTIIKEHAFDGCTRLTNINIPKSVTRIENGAFSECTALESITLPNSVQDIGNSAFYGCIGLTNLNIPNSVISIGDGAFERCTRLTSITIPNSVKEIGIGAFAQCSALSSIKVEKGNTVYDSRNNCKAIIETNSNTLIIGCNNSTIPNNIDSIGIAAFFGCDKLTSITIPKFIKKIGTNAFSACSGLSSIKVEIGNTVYDSRENCNAIIEKKSKTLIIGCKNSTIPNNIDSIGPLAFYGCENLTTINIPYSVKNICSQAFAFCKLLTNITIPNSVDKIGDGAFAGCTGLKNITIPNSVTTIGDDAFANCTGLENFYMKAKTPPQYDCYRMTFWQGYIIDDLHDLTKSGIPQCTLHVPKGCKKAYKRFPWWWFKDIVDDL